MIDISKIKVGDKVHYRPFKNCEDSLVENGKVKEIPDHTNSSIRVVFNCAGEWENFMNYTSQLTLIEKLAVGWKH
jgi:hypothetical protein